jgi:predicted dehydrogenase
MARPQRAAAIGVGHWHTVGLYMRPLAAQKVEIVGMSDPDPAVAEDRAKLFDSTPFTDYREMIEKTKPDFVVALGKHNAMPETFRYLVEAGIPFLMEKPWGTDDKTVRELADLAEAKNAWVSSPFPMRFSHWGEVARRMVGSGELGAVSHIVFRFLQPGVQRYLESGNGWMLTRPEAGGGTLVNLGVHGFDLCRWITGEEPEVVSAVTSRAISRTEVEDYAHVTLRTPSGIIFHNEASYTQPPRAAAGERKVVAEKALVQGTPSAGDWAGSVRVIGPERDETIEAPAGYVGGWERVVIECLNRLERGEGPPMTARDCARAVDLTYDAYRLAGEV